MARSQRASSVLGVGPAAFLRLFFRGIPRYGRSMTCHQLRHARAWYSKWCRSLCSDLRVWHARTSVGIDRCVQSCVLAGTARGARVHSICCAQRCVLARTARGIDHHHDVHAWLECFLGGHLPGDYLHLGGRRADGGNSSRGGDAVYSKYMHCIRSVHAYK